MSKDGLRRLPDHVAADLLRAFTSLQRWHDDQLVLMRAEFGRAPGWYDDKDFNVISRGRRVGRLHYFERYTEAYRKGPWHWYARDNPGRPDAEGSAPTLEAAMDAFRKAWDSDHRRARPMAGDKIDPKDLLKDPAKIADLAERADLKSHVHVPLT